MIVLLAYNYQVYIWDKGLLEGKYHGARNKCRFGLVLSQGIQKSNAAFSLVEPKDVYTRAFPMAVRLTRARAQQENCDITFIEYMLYKLYIVCEAA